MMGIVRRLRAALILLLLAAGACGRLQVAIAPPGPILLCVVTWNMHAGRGDLARLVTDLESGSLSGGRPSAYLILLQEAVDAPVPSAVEGPAPSAVEGAMSRIHQP